MKRIASLFLVLLLTALPSFAQSSAETPDGFTYTLTASGSDMHLPGAKT